VFQELQNSLEGFPRGCLARHLAFLPAHRGPESELRQPDPSALEVQVRCDAYFRHKGSWSSDTHRALRPVCRPQADSSIGRILLSKSSGFGFESQSACLHPRGATWTAHRSSKTAYARSNRAGGTLVSVVQMERTPACGAGNRGFESRRTLFTEQRRIVVRRACLLNRLGSHLCAFNSRLLRQDGDCGAVAARLIVAQEIVGSNPISHPLMACWSIG
jgi:hypothetical protein